jgi:type IV pilus assembly protein PilC
MTTAAATNARFAYQARDQRGQMINGVIAAANLVEAAKLLRADGKYIVDIKSARGAAALTTDPQDGTMQTEEVGSRTRVKRDEVITFTLQLSIMVDTGVPLSESLHALSEQAFSDTFVAGLKTNDQEITGGKDFSSTLEKFPRIFPKYFISLVRASEVSGTMGPMLRKLAEYLVSQRDMTKKVKGALIYPGFMLVMSVSVTIFLLTVVLPKFTTIFKNRNAALPIPTQVLMGISHSLVTYWYCWISGAVLLAVGLALLHKTRRGRRWGDFLKLRMPIFGGMFHKLYLSRSLSTMGTMITSGVQVLDCLAIVKDVAGNHYYQLLWEEVRNKVQNGSQLSEPLLKSPLIPKSVGQMIMSGEKTGELSNVLTRISVYMEEDLRTAIKTSTQFIEPVMIGLMGIMIGGVAIAMLMPILTISRVMAQ